MEKSFAENPFSKVSPWAYYPDYTVFQEAFSASFFFVADGESSKSQEWWRSFNATWQHNRIQHAETHVKTGKW